MKKKGRGLSFDQKREKLLGIFHNTKDVFNYQEIQKLSVKAGIPFPQVKDLLNSLKNDSLIQCQKIGSGVFYWSFPSKAQQILTDRIEFTKKQMSTYESQIQDLERGIQIGQDEREETEEREQKLLQIKSLKKKQSQLEQEIEKYIRFDCQRFQLLKKQNNELKHGINEQTDNLEQIKKFIKKNQIGIKDIEIQQAYGIPHDLDYIQ